jgi:hypothetical protein
MIFYYSTSLDGDYGGYRNMRISGHKSHFSNGLVVTTVLSTGCGQSTTPGDTQPVSPAPDAAGQNLAGPPTGFEVVSF